MRARLLVPVLLVVLAACGGGAAAAVEKENREVSAPERIVQRQIEAYNARDLEAFIAHYAEDVEIFGFPDTLWMSGIDAMRERYGQIFENSPELNAEITNRIVQGAFVIDHELVTGLLDRPPFRATAIYQVQEGRITKVWFIY